ncbi:PqqD family peptide modification chaperone [Microbulbifer sp. 2205BS26-8]|uniref:PqqD family peptide modification chaperone n=1 Tax=Microbulbifer sp. 2205BS26-8 TaxID=3064386 RepID=UPI00273FE6CE|nr:PqqD family peptide modification chaperone [Microbulbifer sp. 2205BS26-8]MDP5210781.1 PqqD family peptide modification chaperone [Microbulbifer sp. 2205BS26-8]
MLADGISQPTAVPAQYRIRDGVAKVVRKGSIVLISPHDGTAVRVSPVAEELMPLLAAGASFDELTQKLRDRYPQAASLGTKLSAFLQQLQKSGLLENDARPAVKRRRTPRLKLFELDPAAALVARGIKALPDWLGRALWYGILLSALCGLLVLIFSGALPHPRQLATEFNGWGLAIFALLVAPLHEAAHAVACRLAGVPVGAAGIMIHNWFVPGPYVETNQTYRIRGRRQRFWVPAAGPAINLIAAGAAAWGLWLLGPDEPTVGFLTTLFLLAVLFLYLDTNPLTPSDGSHMLEALLDDELARVSALSRRRGRLSDPKTVAIYRIAASVHLQGSLVLLYFWWMH